MKERVLIIGSGGREHALAYRLARNSNISASLKREVFVAPGNAGIALEFECLKLKSLSNKDLVELASKMNPDLVIVGPEAPLVQGLIDDLQNAGFKAFGPSKKAARLEAKKSFMKTVCASSKVPTARYRCVSSFEEAASYLSMLSPPYVIKADGLCAGKGVSLCPDLPTAHQTIRDFLGIDGAPKFGEHSRTIILEEYLEGEEVSIFAMCDGQNAALFAPMRDHKRLLDNDQGPNTGGMGATGPLNGECGVSENLLEEIKDSIILPVLKTMKRAGLTYRGILYAGLMLTSRGPKVLEFNVRFGDPEAQALLFGTDVDLFPYMLQVASGDQLETDTFTNAFAPTAAVVMASRGYPDKPVSGNAIYGIDEIDSLEKSRIFFAGVKANEQGTLHTAGGRVLSCVASGATLAMALDTVYKQVKKLKFEGAQYRNDIGASTI